MALMLNVVCSLVSLVIGMMLIMKHTDFKQKVGIGIAGIGIISLLAGIMLNSPATPAANDGEAPVLKINEAAKKELTPAAEKKPAEKKPEVKTETAKPEEKAKTEEKKETKPKVSFGGKDKE